MGYYYSVGIAAMRASLDDHHLAWGLEGLTIISIRLADKLSPALLVLADNPNPCHLPTLLLSDHSI
jgi:hypothetical protein